ncbi:response regulator transcription factor [Paenibacillus sinopodophylli]|uniref:response regulator transcription factor n=1 Tax=Paenibacillus sinopodophylli TaxID=1837342 RepID=UPI00148743D5|nr:response regulator transcription factor [Paenibacillus sinopodophylli]
MYKVLIVDDEKLARESIAKLIVWESYGFELLGTASNGEEALNRLRQEPADIVITDIRMPLMDGLRLIELLKEESPRTEYIVLSGYGDYDYTSVAMTHGVKHYLLKPSNEVKILEVLQQVVVELEERAEQQQFYERLQSDFSKVLPHVKDQLLRDIVLTGIYNKQDCDYFMDLFMIRQQMFKLLLFTFQETTEYFQKFALKNIAEEVFEAGGAYLTTIVQDHVLLLVSSDDFLPLSEKVKLVQRIYKAYYKLELIVAISDEGGFYNIRPMYERVKHCLSLGSAFQEGYIVTPQDVLTAGRSLPVDSAILSERLTSAVQSGRLDLVEDTIQHAIRSFETGLFDRKEAKHFCLDLFLTVIRQTEEGLDEFVPKIPILYEIASLRGAFQFLEETAIELAKRNSGLAAKKQNDLIDSVLQIVGENVSNPELSLKWIANELLYVNVDYLGKLFAKRMENKFSNYLVQLRMELAKKYMEQENELRIYDIAVIAGYPEDAQYFSKVFKKYTGMTPTEYVGANRRNTN